MGSTVYVYKGDAIARYGFGDPHPFGTDRHDAFHDALSEAGLDGQLRYEHGRRATVDELALFHTAEHIERVSRLSHEGRGFLDDGDTPALPGIFDAACDVVGAVLDAADKIMLGPVKRAFIPIAGLHHAARDRAAGFCVFNDCGVVAEYLRSRHGLKRIAYIDIDAHHGDGVYYGFEDDPDLIFADIHEDGRCLYPGTGAETETGSGRARGTKLNIPLMPGADDAEFRVAWRRVEDYLNAARPEFILFQCGADSLDGDPITHLSLSAAAHREAAESLCRIAERHADGRIIGMGGGGYNRRNLALAWTEVVRAMAATR